MVPEKQEKLINDLKHFFEDANVEQEMLLVESIWEMFVQPRNLIEKEYVQCLTYRVMNLRLSSKKWLYAK